MIAIVKYNAGNIASVQNALSRLGAESVVTDKPEILLSADKVIFPGVGEASSAMRSLQLSGLDNVIRKVQQPILGICLGLQLMCRTSEEGNTSCLGIFPTVVKKFPPEDIVPHIGWNTLHTSQSALWNGVDAHDDVYYVHSYYADLCKYTIATTTYIVEFSAAMHFNNYYATQFHPEKSGSVGEKILQNFLRL